MFHQFYAYYIISETLCLVRIPRVIIAEPMKKMHIILSVKANPMMLRQADDKKRDIARVWF